ncbi:hypothetical protein E2C01_038394 [Portunus trituberculatus]|uniref:Uncharacterized protein n=1 Tax=Portunus trituberculatus TaxID=210409 RepID=A0A5B7FGN4_PORTR|nr:hypothetical protein [Portunus trituberculatus]
MYGGQPFSTGMKYKETPNEHTAPLRVTSTQGGTGIHKMGFSEHHSELIEVLSKAGMCLWRTERGSGTVDKVVSVGSGRRLRVGRLDTGMWDPTNVDWGDVPVSPLPPVTNGPPEDVGTFPKCTVLYNYTKKERVIQKAPTLGEFR